MRHSRLEARLDDYRAMGACAAILRASVRFELVDAPSRHAAVGDETWNIALLHTDAAQA